MGEAMDRITEMAPRKFSTHIRPMHSPAASLGSALVLPPFT